jgi:adenylate cyclase
MALWLRPGTLLLYPALAVHGSLGLWALYQRRQFGRRRAHSTVLGLSIPALLCTHLIGQRLGAELWGLQKSYGQALYNQWLVQPKSGMIQVTLLLVAWTHGCIGMYLWLRLRPFFPRVAPLLLAGAVLLPSLALLGFISRVGPSFV